MARKTDLATIILVACAVTVTGVVLKNQLMPPKSPTRTASNGPEPLSGWEALIDESRIEGPRAAKVTLVEFSDFQCPFCGDLARSIAKIREEHPNDVALVYRHFPLTRIHPFAMSAAKASECARREKVFTQFHDLVFANQDSISKESFSEFARRVGITDTVAFEKCAQSASVVAVVQRDIAVAESLGLGSTPSLIVNGELYRGAPTYESLKNAVTKAIDGR